MIFGNKARFAIECELDEDFKSGNWNSITGEAWLWIGGHQVGDYTQYPMRFFEMGECLNYMKYDLGTYYDEAFDGKTTEEVFEIIFHPTYGDITEDSTIEEIREKSQEFIRFIKVGHDLGPGFDGFPLVFINKTPEILCLLWRYMGRDNIGSVHEFCIPNEEYIEVVESFGYWLEEISGLKLDFLRKPEWFV